MRNAQLSTTIVETNDRWFTTASRTLNNPITTATARAAFAVARDGSDRVQTGDAVATIEAATIGAQAAMLSLLEHLNSINNGCDHCEELDRELRELLLVARQAMA